MKKVLVAGAALTLLGGLVDTAMAAAVEPGVKITGDARVRTFYKSEEYYNFFGNTADPASGHYSSSTDMDSRVRVNILGTAAGGAYAFARIRIMENMMGDLDTDTDEINRLNQNNLWADQAYMGIPLGDSVKVELGKFRSTYGPLPLTYNFFYDDVNLTGARGIIKVNDQLEINPFINWMDEPKNVYSTSGSGTVSAITSDINGDNDEIRYGAHLKYTINKDWVVGGMAAYQSDERREFAPTTANPTGITKNSGGFGSVYVNGKSGPFGVYGELAVVAADMNGFNFWYEDSNNDIVFNTYNNALPGSGYSSTTAAAYGSTNLQKDMIGSNDTGWGGYVVPSYTIDKLTLAANMGFTAGGFLPDRAYGFVMLGSKDNSIIGVQPIGLYGDWWWVGFCPSYTFNESLKLTGNFVYADIDPWTKLGDGPGFLGGNNIVSLDSAWEISAVLQYTISKGMDVFLSAGYLDPSLTYVNVTRVNTPLQEDGAFAAAARFELKF